MPVAAFRSSGAEGDRRHFALPLWRMANAASADWAGIVRWTESGPEATTVLDLAVRPGPEATVRVAFRRHRVPIRRTMVETVNREILLPLGWHGESRWAAFLAGPECAHARRP